MIHPRLLRFGLFALMMMIGTFASIPVTQAGDYSVSLEISKATCVGLSNPGMDSFRNVEVSFTMSFTAPGVVWEEHTLSFSPDTGSVMGDVGMYQGDANIDAELFLGDYIGDYGTMYPFTFVLTGSIYTTFSENNNYIYFGESVAETTLTGTCIGPGDAIISGTSGQDAPFDPGDGRLQPQASAPVAIYCRDGGVEIYAINSASEGELALKVDPEALSGDAPSENELIASDGDIRLYRLTTGELQVNVGPDAEGKEYVMIWDGCG